ncbi:MAG TPA: zinc ribbon domain-containing protein [Vicinamibacterales bacterium]|nr:zinc ribbon domain-containing protein [Vicinamibacterales bacterium]
MSSETSTEPQVGGATHDADALQPWQLFTLAGLIGATLTVFFSRGQSPSAVILLSLIVFAASAVGVAMLRTVMPLTTRVIGDGAQVLGGRTRAALEREKTLVLRSIKDLEFDRAMGKLSEKDFTEMGARLRARAAGLMRQLDAGAGYREQIEKEIERRIGKDTTSTTKGVCAQCKTANDLDARFCKQCGAKIGAQS